MSGLGNDQGLHRRASGAAYQIRLTLDAADDLDEALAAHHARSREHLECFTSELDAAINRISVLPHLARFHHGELRVTVLPRCSYRLWYTLDESTRTAILLGLFAITRPRPNNDESLRRWIRRWIRTWWRDMPYLPPLLPDPYPLEGPSFDPTWQEEDTGWWVPRMSSRP